MPSISCILARWLAKRVKTLRQFGPRSLFPFSFVRSFGRAGVGQVLLNEERAVLGNIGPRSSLRSAPIFSSTTRAS